MSRDLTDLVRVSMQIENVVTRKVREVFRTFPTCEEAWSYMTETMRKAANKRSLADREIVRCGYYYGQTVTGKKYGGMHIIKGQHVRPQDNEFYRNLSITKSYYSELDWAMCSL